MEASDATAQAIEQLYRITEGDSPQRAVDSGSPCASVR
jgi:hypothetical protein